MSRSLRWVAVPLIVISAPLIAQEQGDAGAADDAASTTPTITAEDVFANAREAYGPPAPEPECKPAQGDEIVVCGENDDPDKYRVESRLDQGDNSNLSWDGDAPNLEPSYPGVVVARGCFVPPCPAPPAYIIDFSALPETPPGSDADRIGRGLAPSGQGNSAPVAEQPVEPPATSPPQPE